MILVPGFAMSISVVLHLLALGKLLPRRFAGRSSSFNAPLASGRGA